MKTFYKFILIISIVIIITLALPYNAQALPTGNDRTIIGDTYTLESGQILDGDLNVVGGVVEIETNATVNGNVLVLGGLVNIDGTVKGNLTAIGGTVNLNQNAIIEGDLISPVSYVNIDRSASIIGDQIEEWLLPGMNTERLTDIGPFIFRPQPINLFPVLMQLGRTLAITLVMAALGALLLLIMPKPADRMRNPLVTFPWHVLGYGALTAVVMVIFSVFLVVTICLMPVLILVWLTFALAILVGWLVLGYELGERIASSVFKTRWHPVLSAALGNLLLYLIAKGVSLIPCLGSFLIFITFLFALGMTVVTLFGTYTYPRSLVQDKTSGQVVLFERKQEQETEPAPVVEPDPIEMPPPEIPVESHLEEEEKFEEPMDIMPETPIEELDLGMPVIPIEALELGTRVDNILKEANVTTVNDALQLLEIGDKALLDISGFGDKSLDALKTALQRSGYQIPGDSNG